MKRIILIGLCAICIAGSAVSQAAIIDKGIENSPFVIGQASSDLSVQYDYITAGNIGNMIASAYNPESGYEFEFVLGTMDVSDGSDFGAVRDAFGTWVDLPDSAVTMTETTYDGNITLGGTNGENEISWILYDGTNWWVDVLGYPTGAIAVTSTWYFPSTGEIVERDLHFNDTYMYWYTDTDGASPSNNPFYVEHIALHEEGHIYGLKDVYNPGEPGYEAWMGSNNEDLTMYGYSNGLLEDTTLTSVDITAMAMAHPVPEPATLSLLAIGAAALLKKRKP